MSLPLQDRAEQNDPLVRMTFADLLFKSPEEQLHSSHTAEPKPLIPQRALEDGEQYRFHFDMTKCIGCRSCEIACNEQNATPADLRWRRIGEIEGGTYPDTIRHYLSMGCNHCLDADCVKGCPVDAYTKDPITGIVLHSADACIGCQYCVWNCPYSVPQYNPERGVVGKCDMCQGRLADHQEPACVNACPEAAIEIEIVSKLAWRIDYSGAQSPGMPEAGHTISTTRITLPPRAAEVLNRVDAGLIGLEHPHFSLVSMTTLIQAVTGSLLFSLFQPQSPLLAVLLFTLTAIALNISVFHLGRPAYAWRALKMWRRSWLSREVLLFGLFFLALTAYTAAAVLPVLSAGLHSTSLPLMIRTVLSKLAPHGFHVGLPPAASHLLTPLALRFALPLAAFAVLLGIAGTLASAMIYLVPARPSWNLIHTPIDFLLSAALIGSTLPAVLSSHVHLYPVLLTATLWTTNHIVRLARLHYARLWEHRATLTLLNLPDQRAALIAMFGFALATVLCTRVGSPTLACAAAFLAVLLGRYLFFVAVVPLNMARTFTRGGHA